MLDSFKKSRNRGAMNSSTIAHSNFAVTYSLQILGEATKNLSAESKSSEPDMPWREIAGFRNKAAHEYFNVRLSIVWETVEDDIPVLLDALYRMRQRILVNDTNGH